MSIPRKLAIRAAQKGQFAKEPLKKAYKAYKQAAPRATYNTWVSENEDSCFVRKKLQEEPLISVVVPAYNTEPSHFLAMVFSVVNQHYDNWELVIVNASDERSAKNRIAQTADIDTRIKVVTPEKNLGIAGNTNFGIKHCKGTYIAFLDHDDLLHKCALHSVMSAIDETGAGIVYTDEDKIKDDSSLFFEPFLKPRWSPDLFENANYINHFTVIKAEHVNKVKGLRSKCDGAQDYDLLLRVLDECEPKIEHVSRILYHWRAAATSTANDFATKTYVLEAGEHALKEHLERRGIKGTAKAIPGMPGFYATLPQTPSKLSVVIGPVDASNRRLCAVWLQELAKKIDHNIHTELVVGDWLEKYDIEAGFNSTHYIEGPDETYWRRAAAAVSHDNVLCFSNAALPDDEHAISEIIAQASVGNVVSSPYIVGGKMILDAGLVESDHGKQRLFTGCEIGDDSYYGYTGLVRNVAGLTLDIFAAKKDLFTRLAKNKTDTVLTDMDLDNVKDDDTRLIVNPRAKFNFNGTLNIENFRNERYFNPQLAQAHTDLYVKVSSWGNLKSISERDNA